jgi:transcriptional regulator with XRE-family HTH domain
MALPHHTVAELEVELGGSLRLLRLNRNIEQKTLAAQAGVSVQALKNLERGKATLRTLVSILRALGREEWLRSIAPMATINPLSLPPSAAPRQRARRSKAY